MNAFKNWLESECFICGEPLLSHEDVIVPARDHKLGIDEPCHRECCDTACAEIDAWQAAEQLEWEASR